MKIYILSFVMLFSSFIYAQNITGKVRFDEDYYNDDFLSGIVITNTRTQQTTATNENGEFTIEANLSDHLLLTSAYIVKRNILVGEKSFQPDFTIFVDPNLIRLGEVRLHNMNRDVEKNIKKSDDEMNKLYNNLGLDPNIRFLDPKKDVSKFKATDLKNPLRLYEYFTGKNKDERKIRAYENQFKMLDSIEDLFDTEFYVKDCGLPEYKIKEFIRWVNSKQDLSLMLRQSTTEMIKDVFYQRSFEYKRLLNLKKS